jgi:hypothetical protein
MTTLRTTIGQLDIDSSALHDLIASDFRDVNVMQVYQATIERLSENSARLRRVLHVRAVPAMARSM